MVCSLDNFVTFRSSPMIRIAQTQAAAKSAIGPAYSIPSMPINVGIMSTSGKKKIICLDSDNIIPFQDLPIEVKKVADKGCNPLTHVITINILK